MAPRIGRPLEIGSELDDFLLIITFCVRLVRNSEIQLVDDIDGKGVRK